MTWGGRGATEPTELVRKSLLGGHHLRDAGAWWEAAFRTASVGMAVLDGTTGAVLRANPSFAAMLGRTEDELFRTDLRALVDPGDGRRFSYSLGLALRGERHQQAVDSRCERPDGTTSWLRFSFDAVDDGPDGVRQVLLHAQEVTDRRRAENALRASLDQLEEAQHLTHIGSYGLDVRTNRMECSAEMYRIFGLEPGDPIADHNWCVGRIHPDDQGVVREVLAGARRGEPFALDHRIVRADGRVRWVHCRGRAVSGTGGVVQTIVGTIQDVTASRTAQERLLHTALHDPLTGAANRALLRERMTHAFSRRRRDRTEVSMLFVDVDDLKAVNDSLGHAAGDVLLQGVAVRLQAGVRPGDTVARLGGDEFVLLLEDASASVAIGVAERILASLRSPFTILDAQVQSSVSIGIAVAAAGEEADGLLSTADAALYRAKAAGKNRYALFDSAMVAAAEDRTSARRDLASAIERDELVLHYQPIVELATGAVVGIEALVRWRHRQRGLLAPTEFLPLADESGLAVPIGTWVLGEACRQVARWRAAHPHLAGLRLGVNLSGGQLQSADLLDDVRHALESAGLEPASLTLEVSERLVDGPEAVLDRLGQLHGLGVGLAIDDFGGFSSSLSALRRFAPGQLKVDRSVVASLGGDAAMVAGAIDLGHALDLDAVAEGVETGAQAEALARLGCDLAQGQHWRGATAPEELEPWLVARATARPAPFTP